MICINMFGRTEMMQLRQLRIQCPIHECMNSPSKQIARLMTYQFTIHFQVPHKALLDKIIRASMAISQLLTLQELNSAFVEGYHTYIWLSSLDQWLVNACCAGYWLVFAGCESTFNQQSFLLNVVSPAVGAADKASLGVPFAEVVLEDLHELASRGPSFIQENKMAILNQPKLLIVVIITCDGSVGVQLHFSQVPVIVFEDPSLGGVDHSGGEAHALGTSFALCISKEGETDGQEQNYLGDETILYSILYLQIKQISSILN